MPLYEYVNETTGELEEHFIAIKDRVAFETENPHLSLKIGAPRTIDPLRLGTHTSHLPADFREGILGKAKKAHPLGQVQV